MGSVCLRTASIVEWNVLGKYGPHGELFLFLWAFDRIKEAFGMVGKAKRQGEESEENKGPELWIRRKLKK